MQSVLGIGFTDAPLGLDAARQMKLAHAAGFKMTLLSLADEKFDERFLAAQEANVAVGALCLPRDGVNLIWQDDEKWERLHALYRACLDVARAKGVGNVIVAVADRDAPVPTQTGLSHLRVLAEEAREMGIRLLFENTGSAEHFELAVRNCCLGYHGVCFRPALAAKLWGSSKIPSYAKKHLQFVLLDDILDGNDGYVPFDGTLNFSPLVASLAEISYRGVLFARVSASCVMYRNLRYEDFASRTYEGLRRLERLCKDKEGII